MVNKRFAETGKNKTKENANMKIITFQATVGGFKISKKSYGLHEAVSGAAASAGQHVGAVFPAVRGGNLTIRAVCGDRPPKSVLSPKPMLS